jgi:hypothetical protein
VYTYTCVVWNRIESPETKFYIYGWAWWLMPITPAICEAEMRGLQSRLALPRTHTPKKKLDCFSKNKPGMVAMEEV